MSSPVGQQDQHIHSLDLRTSILFDRHGKVCGCPKFWGLFTNARSTDPLPSVQTSDYDLSSTCPYSGCKYHSPYAPSSAGEATVSAKPANAQAAPSTRVARMDRRSLSALEPTAEPSKDFKETCIFWIHDTCKRGDDCHREHELNINWPVHVPPGYMHNRRCGLKYCPLNTDRLAMMKQHYPDTFAAARAPAREVEIKFEERGEAENGMLENESATAAVPEEEDEEQDTGFMKFEETSDEDERDEVSSWNSAFFLNDVEAEESYDESVAGGARDVLSDMMAAAPAGVSSLTTTLSGSPQNSAEEVPPLEMQIDELIAEEGEKVSARQNATETHTVPHGPDLSLRPTALMPGGETVAGCSKKIPGPGEGKHYEQNRRYKFAKKYAVIATVTGYEKKQVKDLIESMTEGEREETWKIYREWRDVSYKLERLPNTEAEPASEPESALVPTSQESPRGPPLPQPAAIQELTQTQTSRDDNSSAENESRLQSPPVPQAAGTQESTQAHISHNDSLVEKEPRLKSPVEQASAVALKSPIENATTSRTSPPLFTPGPSRVATPPPESISHAGTQDQKRRLSDHATIPAPKRPRGILAPQPVPCYPRTHNTKPSSSTLQKHNPPEKPRAVPLADRVTYDLPSRSRLHARANPSAPSTSFKSTPPRGPKFPPTGPGPKFPSTRFEPREICFDWYHHRSCQPKAQAGEVPVCLHLHKLVPGAKVNRPASLFFRHHDPKCDLPWCPLTQNLNYEEGSGMDTAVDHTSVAPPTKVGIKAEEGIGSEDSDKEEGEVVEDTPVAPPTEAGVPQKGTICFYWYHLGYCFPIRRWDGSMALCKHVHERRPGMKVHLPGKKKRSKVCNGGCGRPLCPVWV